MGIKNKTLSVILMLAILGVLGMVVYAIDTSRTGYKFTLFYILGQVFYFLKCGYVQ